MAGGPGASEGGSPGLGWGCDEDRRRGHWPQGTGSQQASTSRQPLSSFEVKFGKEGSTWVTVWQGVVFREKGVRCESRRAGRGPTGPLPCVSDDRATLVVRGAIPQNSPRACAPRGEPQGCWPSRLLADPARSCLWVFRPAWEKEGWKPARMAVSGELVPEMTADRDPVAAELKGSFFLFSFSLANGGMDVFL